jgi:hypothetical protein
MLLLFCLCCTSFFQLSRQQRHLKASNIGIQQQRQSITTEAGTASTIACTTIMDQGWVGSSGPFPKAVDTIPDRAALVLDKYHIMILSAIIVHHIQCQNTACCR